MKESFETFGTCNNSTSKRFILDGVPASSWAVKVMKLIQPSPQGGYNNNDIKTKISSVLPKVCGVSSSNINMPTNNIRIASKLNHRDVAQSIHINRPEVVGGKLACFVNVGNERVIGPVIVTRKRQEDLKIIKQQRELLGCHIGVYYQGGPMLGKNNMHARVNIQFPALDPGDALFFDPRKAHYGPERYQGNIKTFYINLKEKCTKENIFKNLFKCTQIKSRKTRRNSAADVTAKTLTNSAYKGARISSQSGPNTRKFKTRKFNVHMNTKANNSTVTLRKMKGNMKGIRAYIMSPWIAALMPKGSPLYNNKNMGQFFVLFPGNNMNHTVALFQNEGFEVSCVNPRSKNITLQLFKGGNKSNEIKKNIREKSIRLLRKEKTMVRENGVNSKARRLRSYNSNYNSLSSSNSNYNNYN
tara:strand:+ start:1837 stop:3081 length:1245 start_codon:yes stop_codon:yes gene_type:complete